MSQHPQFLYAFTKNESHTRTSPKEPYESWASALKPRRIIFDGWEQTIGDFTGSRVL